MKILAINNYSIEDAIEKSEKGIMPKHHAWGVDYLRLNGDVVDCINYQIPRISYFSSILSLIYQLFFCIKLMFTKREYDVVIAFANPIIGFLPLFKKIGLYNAKLYTIVLHHNRFMFLSSGYEKIFFLSKEIMNEVNKKCNYHNFEYIEWGADLSFYDTTFKEMKENLSQRLTSSKLISTGKTRRDFATLVEVSENLNIPLIIITDEIQYKGKQFIESKRKGINAITYIDLLCHLKESLVNVVSITPIKNKYTLCGLTSVIDGLALGMPTIISDNSNISIDFEKHNLGVVYKEGDRRDLSLKLKSLLMDEKRIKIMGENARKYAEKHDYKKFCRHIFNSLHVSVPNDVFH